MYFSKAHFLLGYSNRKLKFKEQYYTLISIDISLALKHIRVGGSTTVMNPTEKKKLAVVLRIDKNISPLQNKQKVISL